MHSAKDKIQILLMHLFNSCLCSSLDCSASLSLSHTAQVQLCCQNTVQQSAVSVGACTRLEPTTHISWNHVGFYAFPPLRSVASERIKNGMFIITPVAACVLFGIPSAHYIIATYCHSPANAVNMYKALWLHKAYKCCTPLLNLILPKIGCIRAAYALTPRTPKSNSQETTAVSVALVARLGTLARPVIAGSAKPVRKTCQLKLAEAGTAAFRNQPCLVPWTKRTLQASVEDGVAVQTCVHKNIRAHQTDELKKQ